MARRPAARLTRSAAQQHRQDDRQQIALGQQADHHAEGEAPGGLPRRVVADQRLREQSQRPQKQREHGRFAAQWRRYSPAPAVRRRPCLPSRETRCGDGARVLRAASAAIGSAPRIATEASGGRARC